MCKSWGFNPPDPCCERQDNIQVYRADGSRIWRASSINDTPPDASGVKWQNWFPTYFDRLSVCRKAAYLPDGRLVVGGNRWPAWPPPPWREPSALLVETGVPQRWETTVTARMYSPTGAVVGRLWPYAPTSEFDDNVGLFNGTLPVAFAASPSGRIWVLVNSGTLLVELDDQLRILRWKRLVHETPTTVPPYLSNATGESMLWKNGTLVTSAREIWTEDGDLITTTEGGGDHFAPLGDEFFAVDRALYQPGTIQTWDNHLRRYDAGLNRIAEYVIDVPGSRLRRIAASPADGTLVVASRVAVAKVTRQGEILWSRRMKPIPGTAELFPLISALAVDTLGRIAVGCGVDPNDTDPLAAAGLSSRGVIFQLDADGAFQWAHQHNEPVAIACGPNNEIASVGWHPVSGDREWYLNDGLTLYWPGQRAERSFIARTEVLDDE